MASGQKIMIYSIVANFLVSAGRNGISPSVMMVLALIITGFALYGAYRVTTGLGYSTLIKVLVIVALFIPLVNIAVMIYLSMQATKHLRGAGYQVGFFGVKN